MDTIRKKIYLIKKISDELKLEFPNISLKIKKKNLFTLFLKYIIYQIQIIQII